MSAHARALVVDDDPLARDLVTSALSSWTEEIHQANDGHHALEVLSENDFDVVVTDHLMPGIDGVRLVELIRSFSKVPVIVLTAFPCVRSCEQALLSGASRYLDFRAHLDELAEIAKKLVEERVTSLAATPLTSVVESRAKRDEELRRTLQNLLVRTQGNISRVAIFLKKDRSTVLYHLKRLGLY